MICIVRNIKGKTFEINLDKLIENGYSKQNAMNYLETYIKFVLEEKDLSIYKEPKICLTL